MSYFSSSVKKKYKYEGFWANDYNNCVVAIKLERSSPLQYKAYVIESRDSALLPGMVCCEFDKQDDGTFYTSYIDNFFAFRVYVNSEFRNDSVLVTGPYSKWKKIQHYNFPYLNEPSLVKWNWNATGRKLDNNNYLITIPENSRTNARIVDSIVKQDSLIICASKNLIIDIRNNLGGIRRTYKALFPFVYTNPIVQVGGTVYYTEGLINDQKKTIERLKKHDKIDSSAINHAEQYLAKMVSNKGKSGSGTGDTLRLDSVMSYPKNVGIIVNYGCMSAAELMLLDFKQSSKVKVFGERTAGAVDYLDFYEIALPSKKYSMYMPATKRLIRNGENSLDKTGIQPDIMINDSTLDWVKFVCKYYDNN